MKKPLIIKCLVFLIFLIQTCKEKTELKPSMISVPQFEFISKTTINDSTSNINMSLDAFYISNEITNKEYREFTDWVRDNPDEIFFLPKEIIVKKNPEPGKTKVWSFPQLFSVPDILPNLIDSDAMYKIDHRFKNYFTDEKYDNYPVVGVSRNAAEFYCEWLILLERKVIVLRKGQTAPNGMRVKEKGIITISPSYGYYRIPFEMEWNYIEKQPYKRAPANDHKIHKVNAGNPNRWGIFHLHDNVSEWVTIPDDTLAVYRGDNWLTKEKFPSLLRMHPDSSKGYIGFRIARTFKPEEINNKKTK